MGHMILPATLLFFVILQSTDARPNIPPTETSTEDSPGSTVTEPPTPPCCKVFNPPPLFRKSPNVQKGTYQAGDTWNYDLECVEHKCHENGTITINKCPPVPKDIPEGWELKPDSESFNSFYPFCCKKPVPPADPKEPGCYSGNKTVKIGETVDIPGRCYFHVCTGNHQWSISDCGNLGSWHAWEVLPGNTSKPYPDCCGRTVPVLDIVPDVLDDLPSATYLGVVYGNTSVDYGNELAPSQTREKPKVSMLQFPRPVEGTTPENTTWKLLAMTDPDVSSHQSPDAKEFLHWMVGNIPNGEVSAGDVLADYVGPGPPKGLGLHRYVFLLYKQPEKLIFEESRLDNITVGWRKTFSARQFGKKYNLGNPEAFNVFQAQWDESVPELLKQFGIESD